MRFILLLLLSGCTAIDYSTPPPADGWPQLRAVYLDGVNCSAAGWLVVACARPDFDAKECYIWPKNPPQWMKEHEEAHCAGYDHYGDSTVKDYFRQWKENKNVRPSRSREL